MVHRKGVRIVMWTSDTVFQLPLDAQESCVAVQLTGTLSAASVVFTLVRGMLRPGARGPGRVSVSLSLRLRCRTTSCRPARWPAWRRHTASSPLTCRSAHAENRLDRPACRGVRRGLVDLVEVVKGDQTIEGEAALHVQVQELRDEHIGNAVALHHAHQRLAALHEGVRRHTDHGILRGGAEYGCRSPLAQGLDHLADQRGQTCGVEGVVDALTGDATDLLHGVLLAAVDGVGGAELGGEFE